MSEKLSLMTAGQVAEYFQAIDFFTNLKLPDVATMGGPNRKVYVVSFDGTGNNQYAVDETGHPAYDGGAITNVAQISNQAAEAARLSTGDALQKALYQTGVGTTQSLADVLQQATGLSFVKRVTDTMSELAEQIAQDRAANPELQPYLIVTGFSRGAGEARLFMNLVNEFGIPNSADQDTLNTAADGSVHITYPSGAISAAGSVRMSALLYDTVPTGQTTEERAQTDHLVVPLEIPPTVDSLVHITSQDEARKMFGLWSVAADGQAVDQRLVEVALPGAHSDIGGGYNKILGVEHLNEVFGQMVLRNWGVPLSATTLNPSLPGGLLYGDNDSTDLNVSTGSPLWVVHDSSTWLTHLAEFFVGKGRSITHKQNPTLDATSQTEIDRLYSGIGASAVPPALALGAQHPKSELVELINERIAANTKLSDLTATQYKEFVAVIERAVRDYAAASANAFSAGSLVSGRLLTDTADKLAALLVLKNYAVTQSLARGTGEGDDDGMFNWDAQDQATLDWSKIDLTGYLNKTQAYFADDDADAGYNAVALISMALNELGQANSKIHKS